MIGRIWHGAVPVEKSDAYFEKMRTVALPGYRRVDGNRGAWVMRRIEGDVAHFDMLSFWDDVDAIKRLLPGTLVDISARGPHEVRPPHRQNHRRARLG